MKLLQSSQKYLAMLGISSNYGLANVNFFMTEFVSIIRVCFDWTYLIFEAKTFREYTYSALYSSTTIQAALCFTIFATKRTHLFKMIEISEKLIDKRSNNATRKEMYTATNRQGEKLSKIAFVLITIIIPILFIFPNVIFVYSIYFTTDLGNDSFAYTLYGIWLPYDWKSPIGFAIVSFIQYVFTLYLYLIATAILSTAVSGLLLTRAVVNDLRSFLTKINENGKSKKKHSKATRQFTDFVQLHTLVIQLLIEFLLIIEQMGMIFFTWASITVCSGMLLAQWEVSKPEIDLIALIVFMGILCSIFCIVCIACELGQRVSNIFACIADVIEQFQWYRHPAAMRKMFFTILPIVQKPVDIKCFGSSCANRETCKKILNGGFSYFTVLRNFTN